MGPENESAIEQEIASLPNLDRRYHIIRRLGSGANDTAILIQDEHGIPFVALRSNQQGESFTSRGWGKIQRKLTFSNMMDELGLVDYAVHCVEQGKLTLPVYGSLEMTPTEKREALPVAIVEYGGKSIASAESENDKLEIIRSIRHVLSILHHEGWAVKDFKDDHWVYTKDSRGKVQVKLIDYTQMTNFFKFKERFTHDLRESDLGQFRALVTVFFPWFRQTVNFTNDDFPTVDNIVNQDLERLTVEITTFTRKRKLQERLINILKGDKKRP